ncbi:MAG TPA: hypothetical protein VNH11_33905 [Pirellulales bacterium]|nr:hypothetical protein [Pirellulales bacterium]
MTASTGFPVPVTITPIVSLAPPAELKTVGPLGVHPAATLFPMMHGPELGLLVEDIEAHGLREPVVLFEGQVLDGRNRLRACELAGIEPRFEEWDAVGSPLAFVLSRNLHRRHLNESQRSIIGARAKGMFEDEAAERKASTQFAEGNAGPTTEVRDDKKHRETTVGANLHPPCAKVNAQAAALLNVSARSIATASKVLESGDEQVIDAISEGTISVSDAATVIDLPKPKQRQALEEVRRGRARTLKQAAKIEDPEEPPSASSREVGEQLFSRKRLRIECKRFALDLEKLRRRVDAVATACGGPNDYTQRACDCLSVALRAIQECLMNCNRRTGP